MQIKDSHSQQRGTQHGRGLIGTIIRLGFFAVVIVVLAQAVEILYRFYDLKNQVAYLAQSAEIEPDLELRKKVLALTKRAGIECAERDIVSERSEGLVRLEIRYRHPVGVPFANPRWKFWGAPLHFSVQRRFSVERRFSVQRRFSVERRLVS